MAITAADHVYTTVRNTSGRAQFFGFLGAHGVKLAANAEYSVPGDLAGKLANKTSKRQFDAFVRAVEDDLLMILKTPTPMATDAATDPGAVFGGVSVPSAAVAPELDDYDTTQEPTP